MKGKGIFIFKKFIISFLAIVLSVFSLFAVYFSKNKPVFSDFSKIFEVSLNSSSSTCQFKVVNEFGYNFLFNITGEAFFTNKYSVEQVLSYFNADIVFTEVIDKTENIYAYSKKIKYLKIINGKKVNIQIANNNKKIKVGSPIIFGSF